MENNITGLPYYERALPKEPGEADISEAQHPTETYDARVPDKYAEQVPQRNFLAAPGSGQSGSACSEPTYSSTTEPDTVAEQREEEFIHLEAPKTSIYTQGSPENWHSGVHLGDQFPGRDMNHGPLSAALESGQSGFACSDPPHPPSKRASVAEKRKEEFPGLHTANTVQLQYALRGPENWHQYPPGMYFDDQFPSRGMNYGPLSATPESGQSGFARSDPLHPPSKRASVAEQRKEQFPGHHNANAVQYALHGPENWHQHPSGMYFDGQFPDKDANLVPQYDFPAAPGNEQSGLAGSESIHRSIKATPVSEQRKEVVDLYTRNIVIFGETGVGKSSIINVIADQKLARTSNDALGCTFQHERYPITLGKMLCALWDTTGLDEGSEGTVPAKLAENHLRELMRGLVRSGGIHLVIYCIRGTRLTKALKRNYDLFYVTVCRKKVHVALVVTGLEHQQGEMETWWSTNEAALRRNGMRFDAHACVTTLNAEDHVIQQRRSDSRTLLRELVVKYSVLPAWKTDLSFISRVLPVFHSVFRGTSFMGSLGNTTTIRKVTICGSPTEFLPGTTAVWDKSTGRIGDRQYEFLRVDKHALDTLTPGTLEDVGGVGAGVLVFYTSALVDNRIPPTDVDALKRFYDCAGGQTCPVIIVLRGCNDEKVAQACCVEVASHHSHIQAHFVSLPSTDDAQARLGEMIESLCIEQVEVRTHRFFRRYMAGKRFLASFVDVPFQ